MRLLAHLFLLIIAIICSADLSTASDISGNDSEEELILAVNKIYNEGAYAGQRDGMIDGADLSARVAFEQGSLDGKYDGEEQGMMDVKHCSSNRILQKKIPEYPGDFDGPNYKPKIYHIKLIMIKAFADGYNLKYRQYTRLEFKRKITLDYNQNYDANFKIAYDLILSSDHP